MLLFLQDHSVEMKESEKIRKSLNIARDLKKLWNIKVMVILIVVGALGTVFKVLEKRMAGLEISARPSKITVMTN